MDALVTVLVLSVGVLCTWQIAALLRRRRSREMEQRQTLRERLQWLAGEDIGAIDAAETSGESTRQADPQAQQYTEPNGTLIYPTNNQV
jgi:hypothetical protein